MKIKKNNLLLFFIICLALFLRIWQISNFPAGLNADEAAIGYNAYSLIQTGRDEFGHPWPMIFQSFNDFKPGIYFYLVLPFVKLFGLNELSVRLPSAILGTLTVFVVYFLVRKLMLTKKSIDADFIAATASFILAVSPWHLHFSRGGWEPNAATFFITTGVYFFFRAMESPGFFIPSSLLFILSMYTYHSSRIIAPLMVVGLAVFYKKIIFKKENFKWIAFSVIFGLVLVTPLIKSLFSERGTSRFSGVGIFADKGPLWRANELRGMHKGSSLVVSKILHNQYLEYTIRFVDNYLRHFDGTFLFVSGDEIQRNKVPEMGQIYLVEFPFLLLGIYYLLKKRPFSQNLIFWWLLISPVASAFTFQSPHAYRSFNMVIPFSIITAYGFSEFYFLIKKRFKFYFLFYFLYFGLFLWNFVFYLHQYYVQYPQIYPSAWEYGFKDLVKYVKTRQDKFEKIYVTGKYDQPYILFAFYLKYPPEEFQKEAKLTERDNFGFSTVDHFGRYYFGPVDQNKLKEPNCLIIGTPEEIPDSATITKRIYFKDGKTEAFRIVEN